jgi:hypothetical protein
MLSSLMSIFSVQIKLLLLLKSLVFLRVPFVSGKRRRRVGQFKFKTFFVVAVVVVVGSGQEDSNSVRSLTRSESQLGNKLCRHGKIFVDCLLGPINP